MHKVHLYVLSSRFTHSSNTEVKLLTKNIVLYVYCGNRSKIIMKNLFILRVVSQLHYRTSSFLPGYEISVTELWFSVVRYCCNSCLFYHVVCHGCIKQDMLFALQRVINKYILDSPSIINDARLVIMLQIGKPTIKK